MTEQDEMMERGILFSAPMVVKLLSGEKTQTRRIVKPQPEESFRAELIDDWEWKCPYGAPGDRLWVRETWVKDPDNPHAALYRADIPPEDMGDAHWIALQAGSNWKPSISMPRWASRITLEITGVKVERLQDISEEDAKAEGVEHTSEPFTYGFRNYGQKEFVGEMISYHSTARESFESLWDSINAKKCQWASNPWVWVISFEKVKP